MPVDIKCKLLKKEELKPDILRYTVLAKEIANIANPGQFLEIKCSDSFDPLLRRPISISDINKKDGTLQFIFQIKGNGTTALSKYDVNEELDIIGPLGNGYFSIKEAGNIAIIGGGIGIFPLLELSKHVGKNATVYLGFRNKELIVLENEFKSTCKTTVISTDDGSYGKKGFTTELFLEDYKKNKYDFVYACGPMGMLKVLKTICDEHKIDCELSLEENMGCGIGACLGCATKVKDENAQGFKYVHVCKHGPVFVSNILIF